MILQALASIGGGVYAYKLKKPQQPKSKEEDQEVKRVVVVQPSQTIHQGGINPLSVGGNTNPPPPPGQYPTPTQHIRQSAAALASGTPRMDFQEDIYGVGFGPEP